VLAFCVCYLTHCVVVAVVWPVRTRDVWLMSLLAGKVIEVLATWVHRNAMPGIYACLLSFQNYSMSPLETSYRTRVLPYHHQALQIHTYTFFSC
jgi:hypothetical protein